MRKETEDYKTLFFHSPLPKLIYDVDTLQIQEVNVAAVNIYGYTKEEFLNMALTDIYPGSGEAIRAHHGAPDDTNNSTLTAKTEHMGKGGRQIFADVRLNCDYLSSL